MCGRGRGLKNGRATTCASSAVGFPAFALSARLTAYDWPDNVTQHKEFIEVDKENGLNVLILLVFREQER